MEVTVNGHTNSPSSQCPETKLHIQNDGVIPFEGEEMSPFRWMVPGHLYVNLDSDTGLGPTLPSDTIRVGVNVSAPQSAIHIRLENGSEFTDADIRQWARGNLANIDFATGEESLVIESLCQIIVEKVLAE